MGVNVLIIYRRKDASVYYCSGCIVSHKPYRPVVLRLCYTVDMQAVSVYSTISIFILIYCVI